jgi:predicted permease
MRLLEEIVLDARYAARTLRGSPGFAAAAIVSLALGIGGNTAIFSLLDVLMLRPLPVDQPASLVALVRNIQNLGTSDAWPYPAFLNFRTLEAFASATASSKSTRANLRVNGQDASGAGKVVVGLVSGDYFSTLGVRAAMGRTLQPDDDRAPGSGTVAVISDAFWRRQFAGARDVLGQTLTFDSLTYTIVGVGPQAFSGEDVGDPSDLWVPITMESQVVPEQPGLLTSSGSSWVHVIGRLKRGVTAQQAESAARALFKPSAASWRANQRLDVVPAGRGFSRGREFLQAPLTLLLAVVGLVLVLACANVATLLVARSAARRKELAVRLAMGAGRGRLVRQLLTESLMLSTIAGALGLAAGAIGGRALAAMEASGRLRIALDVHLDWRMLVVTSAFSLLSGLIFGIAPAFAASRFSLTGALTGSGRAGASPRSTFRSGRVLIILQIAITLVLTIGAGLLVQTLTNLETQDVGFDRDQVWLFFMDTRTSGKRREALAPLFAAAEERMAAIPDVMSSSVSSDGVLSGFIGLRAVTVAGRAATPDEDVNAQWNLVGPRFFQTLGIQLLTGRDFASSDTDTSPHVAIVNEAMAHHFFGEANPIGQHFSFGQAPADPLEVVGVVHNSKYFSARDANVRMVYLPYRQNLPTLYRMCVVVRTKQDDPALVSRIRDELRRIDPTVPVGQVTSTTDLLNATLTQDRVTAWLVGLFGGLAVELACIGLYGVMTCTVTQRTREIGIRVAVGATRGDVMRKVLGETLQLVGLGLVIGLPATVASSRSIQSILFGVRATDPETIGAGVLLMVGVAIAAGLVPAYRASRVNPIVALRSE